MKKRRGKYHEAEQELYDAIMQRRSRGRHVSGKFITAKMQALVGPGAQDATFGPAWLYRFVRRWKLSWRRATKRKDNSTRLHRAQRFHQGLRKLLVDENQERGPRALHPKWGRFLPQHRFNWDEIPLAFIGGLSHTWHHRFP